MENKHFENIWEEAEKIAKEYYNERIKEASPFEEESIINQLELIIQGQKDKKEFFGRFLFVLCFLSDRHGINTWTALADVMEHYKIQMLEED